MNAVEEKSLHFELELPSLPYHRIITDERYLASDLMRTESTLVPYMNHAVHLQRPIIYVSFLILRHAVVYYVLAGVEKLRPVILSRARCSEP